MSDEPKTDWSALLDKLRPGFTETPAGSPWREQSRSFQVTPTSDPSRQAGAATQAAASLPTDLQDRVRYFAERRFPDMPIAKAMSHYGIERGRIYYMEGGKAFYEEPQFTDMTRSLRGAANYVASGAGPSIPLITGTAGGVATMPFTFGLGGIPGAASAAYAGDAMRQGLAEAIVGDTGFDPWQGVYEAIMSGTAQGLGRLAIVFANRRLARDFNQLAATDVQAAIQKLTRDAADEGIILTPAEKTQLGSLINQQRWLAGQPRSANRMRDFYADRESGQIAPAIARNLDEISPVASRELGEAHLKRGATNVVDYARRARGNIVNDMYDDAYAGAPGIDVKPTLALIDDMLLNAPQKTPFRAELLKVKASLTRMVETETVDPVTMQVSFSSRQVPEESLKLLHRAMITLSETIGKKGPEGLAGTVKRDLTIVKRSLRESLEGQSPAFAGAQAAFKSASPPVRALVDNAVGTVRGLEGTAVSRAPRTIFTQGPKAIARDRAAFVRAHNERPNSGVMDDWNAGLRSYLQSVLDKATKATITDTGAPQGAKFYVAVFGKNEQRAALKAAMSEEQFGAFQRLMMVLKASGRVPRVGSPTQPLQEISKEMKRQHANKLLQGVAAANNPLNILPRLANFWDEVTLGKHTATLAEIITSPNNMANLRELSRLPPFGERARIVAWELIANFVEEQVGQGLSAVGFSESQKPTEGLERALGVQ